MKILTSLLVFFVMAGAAAAAPQTKPLLLEKAEKVTFSDGQVVRVVYSYSGGTMPTDEWTKCSLIIDDMNGNVMSANFAIDYRSGAASGRLVSGRTAVQFTYDYQFLTDGMPLPFVIDIDGKRYRTILDSAYSKYSDRITSALENLPESVRHPLRLLYALLNDTGEGHLMVPSPGAILDQFLVHDFPQGLVSVEHKKLTDDEKGALESRASSK